MLPLLYALLATARSSLRPQRELALENLALRQRLAILKRKSKRPKLTKANRAFWVAFSRLWPDWQSALILLKPETVIGWHRKGFKLYWSWRSRNRGGRSPSACTGDRAGPHRAAVPVAESVLRARESIDGGKVIALPMVGGLHHRYTRRRARA